MRSDFIGGERSYLKANFTMLPAERADAIEHVERNRDATEVVLNEAQPVQRARYLHESRPLALDAARFPLRLADTMEQAYEVLLKRREPDPCSISGQPRSPALTPNLRAGCDP